MHLIHDENGNICAHAHDHEHAHHHTYEHSHVHSHEHGHEEDHHHSHEHSHDHTEGCSGNCNGCGSHTHDHEHHTHTHETPAGDKMTALIDYMLKHNEHHAAELDQVAAKLMAAGKTAAAEQIKKAVDEYQKGNLYLSLALASVKMD